MKIMKWLLMVILITSNLISYGQDMVSFDTIKLLKPDIKKGMPLMQALNLRKTTRELSDKKLTFQQLSELLWAANGINREDGKRTAPAAMNKQFVDLYVVLQEGIYKYNAILNRLEPVKKGDYRKETGSQDFVSVAAVNLLYVADQSKLNDLPSRAGKISTEEMLKWAYTGAGCQAENVSLYCASEGLGTVIRVSVDGAKIANLMNFLPGQTVLLAQTVGVVIR
jgi:nitroreductase